MSMNLQNHDVFDVFSLPLDYFQYSLLEAKKPLLFFIEYVKTKC